MIYYIDAMQAMQAMIDFNDFNLEHVVLAFEDVDKKIMDVEDGYTLQYDVETNNGFANIQLDEDELLLKGVMRFDIFHTPKDSVQTTVKIYRDKKSAILHCETTGDNDLANLVLTEILKRYYATLKK
jgi:hypothetical protein